MLAAGGNHQRQRHHYWPTEYCNAGNPTGADTIVLDITSTITIQGNGATIQRSGVCTLDGSTAMGEFRIFEVASTGDLTLRDVTVRNGCADATGHNAEGGGIWNGGTANLSFVTIASNSAINLGGGIRDDGNGTVNIKNSIVGNNTSGSNQNCSNAGTFNATGKNFDADGSCAALDADFSQVPSTGVGGLNLGSLQVNPPGATATHALQLGSVAIDAVPLGQCTIVSGAPVTTDQRGVARPVGSNCDVGASEASVDLVRGVTLQGGGNCLLLDLQNRTYRFRTSTGDLYTGSIRFTRRGSQIQFSNLRTGETWIMGGTADLTPLGRGRAVLRTFYPFQIFRIDDPNLSGNTCVP